MVSFLHVEWSTFKALEEAGLVQPTDLLQLFCGENVLVNRHPC